MAFIKVKMDLSFPSFPFIYAYIESDYNKCVTEEDYLELVYKFLNISETTNNKVKQEAYETTAKVVYSKLTGRTWESVI